MLKTKTKPQLGWLRFLERELLSLLALFFILLLTIYSRASDTAEITFSVTVFDASATITVLIPNGGEDWTIGGSQTITWETTGDVPDVKIELTRNGSTYETLTASTTNDGSYPWTVTGAATSSAKIKISDVLNPPNYDESNTVFTIAEQQQQQPGGGGGGGGGGGVSLPPALPVLEPAAIYSVLGAYLKVRHSSVNSLSRFALKNTKLELASLPVFLLSSSTDGTPLATLEIKPKILSPGIHSLILLNGDQPEVVIATLTVLDGQLSSRWVRQSDYPTVSPGEELELWVEFRNTGTAPWLRGVPGAVRLATSRPRDRSSRFQSASWLSKNRLTLIDQETQPGGIGRFTFKMKAPSRVGTYREYVQPVAEFSEWISPDWGVYWNIKVERPKQISLRQTISKVYSKIAPKSVPKTAAPSTPEIPQKSLLARFLDAVSNFFGRGFAGRGIKTGD